jgi:hypothetical protein
MAAPFYPRLGDGRPPILAAKQVWSWIKSGPITRQEWLTCLGGPPQNLLPGFAKKNLLGKRRRVSISWVSRFIGSLPASKVFYHYLERNSRIISGNFPWLPVDNFPGRPYLMHKTTSTWRKRRWGEKWFFNPPL